MKFISRTDLANKSFGFLTVRRYAFTKNKKAYWECICVCGTAKVIRGSHLSSSKITSCGCKTRELLSTKNRKFEPRISSARKIYGTNYSDGNLSFEDFFKISQLPCHYCGAPPNNLHNRWIGKTGVKSTIENGDFVYSGLDRLDAFKPHDLDNVVPCCSICNYAKLQMGTTEFSEWIMRISSNYLFRLSVSELEEAVELFKNKKGK